MKIKQKVNLSMNDKKQLTAAFKSGLFFCIALFASFAFSFSYAKAETLNDKTNFIIDSDYDFYNQSKNNSIPRTNIDATLRKVSNYAYFYVENEYYDSLEYAERAKFDSDLDNLVFNFDNIIYPNMHDKFGNEWYPGIDNDERITILFTKTKENVGGYFNPNDEYPRSDIVDEKSNEREMLYLNAIFVGNERIESFIAHEFQHMITWYHKTKLKSINDDIWLNEARSEYASTAIGYDDDYKKSNLHARAETFMQSETVNEIIVPNQDDSLTEWKNKIYDYSSVNLFSQYVADHFGGRIWKTMTNNTSTGIKSIEESLKAEGYPNMTFRNIFTNWTIANYVNDKSFSEDGIFGYNNANLSYENFHFKPTKSYTMDQDKGNSVEISGEIKDWSSKYYEFYSNDPGITSKNLAVKFNGDNSGKFAASYVLYKKDQIVKIDNIAIDSQQDAGLYIENFDLNFSSLVLILSSQKQNSNFGGSISSYPFTVIAKADDSKIYSDGSLLESTNNSKVYLIENGKKRWFSSAAAFISRGYKWKNIIIIPENELNVYPDGTKI